MGSEVVLLDHLGNLLVGDGGPQRRLGRVAVGSSLQRGRSIPGKSLPGRKELGTPRSWEVTRGPIREVAFPGALFMHHLDFFFLP